MLDVLIKCLYLYRVVQKTGNCVCELKIGVPLYTGP